MEAPKVGFYYHPQLVDEKRVRRAHELGKPPPPTDLSLARTAHTYGYPKIYSLDHRRTEWDDTDPDAVRLQLKLIEDMGADFIAINSFAGYKSGKPYVESEKALEVISQEIQHTSKLKFYTTMCMRLQRAVLPIDEPGQDEPNRYFDLSLDTLNYMMEYSAQHWDNPHYLHVNNKPVVGIYGLTSNAVNNITYSLPQIVSPAIGTWMKATGQIKFKKNPYLIGIVDVPLMVPILEQRGFDLITTMCGLPDFFNDDYFLPDMTDIFPNKKPVPEEYSELLRKRSAELSLFAQVIKGGEHACHVIGSISLGWNTRARAAHPDNYDFTGYPYSPFVKDPTPEDLHRAFLAMGLYIHAVARLRFPYQYTDPLVHVFAFNEFSEALSPIPRVKDDGGIDTALSATLTKEFAQLKQVF